MVSEHLTILFILSQIDAEMILLAPLLVLVQAVPELPLEEANASIVALDDLGNVAINVDHSVPIVHHDLECLCRDAPAAALPLGNHDLNLSDGLPRVTIIRDEQIHIATHHADLVTSVLHGLVQNDECALCSCIRIDFIASCLSLKQPTNNNEFILTVTLTVFIMEPALLHLVLLIKAQSLGCSEF